MEEAAVETPEHGGTAPAKVRRREMKADDKRVEARKAERAARGATSKSVLDEGREKREGERIKKW